MRSDIRSVGPSVDELRLAVWKKKPPQGINALRGFFVYSQQWQRLLPRPAEQREDCTDQRDDHRQYLKDLFHSGEPPGGLRVGWRGRHRWRRRRQEDRFGLGG